MRKIFFAITFLILLSFGALLILLLIQKKQAPKEQSNDVSVQTRQTNQNAPIQNQPIEYIEINSEEEALAFLNQNDTDMDGLPNDLETKYGFDPNVPDWSQGTPDTDSDDVTDENEKVLGTDPNLVDTDNDGFSDFTEVSLGLNPLTPDERSIAVIDTDADGLSDDAEQAYGTDPNNPDTDGDTYRDGDEVQNGFNPLGEGKLP